MMRDKREGQRETEKREEPFRYTHRKKKANERSLARALILGSSSH